MATGWNTIKAIPRASSKLPVNAPQFFTMIHCLTLTQEIIKQVSIPRANAAPHAHFSHTMFVIAPFSDMSIPDIAKDSSINISAMTANRCCVHLTPCSRLGNPLYSFVALIGFTCSPWGSCCTTWAVNETATDTSCNRHFGPYTAPARPGSSKRTRIQVTPWPGTRRVTAHARHRPGSRGTREPASCRSPGDRGPPCRRPAYRNGRGSDRARRNRRCRRPSA